MEGVIGFNCAAKEMSAPKGAPMPCVTPDLAQPNHALPRRAAPCRDRQIIAQNVIYDKSGGYYGTI